MEVRQLGPLEVSLVGVGCNNFGTRCDVTQTRAVVGAALDAGVTLFDTADIYGQGRSEEFLGVALGRRRDEVVIATKFGMQMGDEPDRRGASPRWIARAVEDSLRRLGTDRIDLYQVHAPDPDTPIEDTLGALDALVTAGKVRAIGHSNFSGEQIEEAERVAADAGFTRFVSAQNHYSLLARDADEAVLPACEKHGLGFLPYFPLASGVLTGKYHAGEEPPAGTRLAGVPEERRARWLSDDNLATVERLRGFAEERSMTLLEVAMAWLAARAPVASIIAGATKPEQVRANVAAARAALSAEDLAAIDTITL